ncbi:MAG: hypothetical protein GY702_01495 [Desulfobulbaceae bacterium]|nr:hypothetical protein [Desulfobulbaceae bacterium]
MTSLLVPISLDVLMARDQTEIWADTVMRTPKTQTGRRVRQQLDADPFATLKESRTPGAYLHWALPDALTRGKVVDDELTLPPAPNRWLVIRLTTEAGSTHRRVDAWLLPEAGAEHPEVVDDVLSGGIPGTDVGTVEEITALGFGSLGWAGYFDNVVDRFAFHDPLDDITGAVAYTVLGWYTDAGLDPIDARNEADFFARLDDLDWSLTRTLASGEPFPTQSVYFAHALAHGWPTPEWHGAGDIDSESDLRPDPSSIEIAIGETIGEASVSILDNDLDPLSARMLEARLSGIFGDATGIDGLADIQSKLNAARFGSAPGEESTASIWQADPTDDDNPGAFREVERASPRRWHATDPSVVLQGAGRSGKHGEDGRFGENDDLLCRVSGDCVAAFGVDGVDVGKGDAVLDGDPLAPIEPKCEVPAVAADLLIELASLDPGSAPDLASTPAADVSPVARLRAAWWESFAAGAVEASSIPDALITGILPSPLAIAPPERPWSPMHLDWEVSYLPSTHGTHDWDLGESDYELKQPPEVPDESGAVSLSGRTMLSATAAKLIEFALASDSGEQAPTFDLVGGALEQFVAKLRGDDLSAIVTADHGRLDEPFPLGDRPDDFRALRAGYLRLEKLRLVDGFGQFIDIADSAAGSPPLPALGATLTTPQHPGLAALRPRFTAPAQISLRFTDAAGADIDADDAISPVCGYVLPSPRETSLEIFNVHGIGLGQLYERSGSTLEWQEPPGTPSRLGARPSSRIGNAVLGTMVDALFDIDHDFHRSGEPGSGALHSLLRMIDVSRWTTDLTGTAGDQHLSLILGQPAVIVRAKIRIDVFDERNPPENATTAVAVRLGSLAQMSDGLLGFYLADDYRQLRIVDPALADVARRLEAGSLLASFVNEDDAFFINPGIDIPLTLIMEPSSNVEVTCGLLPQKRVGLRRDWTSAALSRISPNLHLGPLLRDEDSTRIPVPSDIRGNWTWHRRPDPSSWATDEVVPATTAALLPDGQVIGSSGWLRVELLPDNEYDGAIASRIEFATKNAIGGIAAIGGRNADGTIFMLPVGQAVELQESGRFSFYVQEGSDPTPLQIVHLDSGRRYMRSTADTTDDNNLANLAPPPKG